MEYKTKLIYQSNYWYNDGLKKANIRDLSGAIKSLRRSLQYNRGNIAARNLLGLAYYGRGDVVEALVEWILSKNFQSHDNIANYYIGKIQEVPGELEEINQTVKQYNQCLEFAKQNGEDMAIIQLKKIVAKRSNYVKARQLLALLYIQTGQIAKAREELRAAYRMDTTDELTLRYMHEVTQKRKNDGLTNAEMKRKKGDMAVSYQMGNETIIQPAPSLLRENLSLHSLVNMLIGGAIGIAFMAFLVMPALNHSKQKDLNNQIVEFSDKIATQEAQIGALKTELDEYRVSSEESESAKETAESTQESYEIVLNVYKHFNDSDMSDSTMLTEMLKVSPDSLGELGKNRYQTVADELFPRMCDKLYGSAQDEYDAANYSECIDSLEKIIKMDENYGEGKALLLLAQSYEKQGDQDKANLQYQNIIEKCKNTEAAKSAQKALDAQNGKGTQGEESVDEEEAADEEQEE